MQVQPLRICLAPILKVECSLTSNTYRRSAPDTEKPRLIVKTTLFTPATVTFELIGEFDTQTILGFMAHDYWFRMQNFSFVDVATGEEVINKDPFPGTCIRHGALLARSQVLEIHASEPHVTEHQLEDVSPLSDPVRQLEVGHEYVIKLIPQKIKCYEMEIEKTFQGREYVPKEELPEAFEVVLASEDELRLKIEE